MVEDINNFNEVYEAVDIAVEDGMAAVHELTMQQMLANWESGQDAMGNNWAPLADSTLETATDSTPLIDSGALKADVEAESYYDADSTTSVIQTDMARGVYHEFGAPEQGLPARPIFGPAGAYAASLLPDELDALLDMRLMEATL